MVVLIVWKLELLKIFLKLTSKREFVATLLEYNYFDYFFQVLFVNVTVWVLLWLLTLFSALDISVNTTHPEILRLSKLHCESKINWRGHEIFLEKVTGPWNIQLYDLLGYKMFFEKSLKPSAPLPPPTEAYLEIMDWRGGQVQIGTFFVS